MAKVAPKSKNKSRAAAKVAVPKKKLASAKKSSSAGSSTKTSAKVSIKALVDKQREFFYTNTTRSPGYRIAALKKLKQALVRSEQELYAALAGDFQKHEFESYITEFSFALEDINRSLKNIKKWAAPQKVRASFLNYPSKDAILYEPYGVALVIAPWNYPFQLAMGPLIGAISAGNTCVLKPSELTPKTSALISKICAEVFDPKHVAVVEGGVDVSTSLLEQKFDFIFFTGSTHVGRVVAQAAAKHLTPVILELGGKSPCFVDSKADLKIAAKRIAWGKYMNGGQTCVAPDYVVVHKSVKDTFLKELAKVIESFYGSDPQKSGDFARIINQRNFDRLSAMLKKGKIYYGGQTDKSERYIAPTIVTNVRIEDPIMKEEIFGPLLPILEFSDYDEAMRIMNNFGKPLALYLFTQDNKVKKKFLFETTSGDIAINDVVAHLANPNLPFGGVGESGMGAYHGKTTFEAFSHKKSVMDKGTWYDNALRYPPYSKSKLNLAKRMMKLFG